MKVLEPEVVIVTDTSPVLLGTALTLRRAMPVILQLAAGRGRGTFQSS